MKYTITFCTFISSYIFMTQQIQHKMNYVVITQNFRTRNEIYHYFLHLHFFVHFHGGVGNV